MYYPGFNDCYIMVGADGSVLEYSNFGSIIVDYFVFKC